MTVALEGGEWSAARPDRTLLPGKPWYQFYRRNIPVMSVNVRKEQFFRPCCVLYHVTECDIISTAMR